MLPTLTHHVEANGIGQLHRPHGHAEGARRLVDLLLGLAALHALQRRHHVGAEHAVDDEAGAALGDQRELVDGRDEGAALLHLLVARLRTLDDLHQRHLRHRIEEVDADQAAGVGERLGDLLDHDGGGVGREHRAGLQLALDRLEEVLLGLQPLHDGLDHHVGAGDVGTAGIGEEARRGGVALRLGPELAGEQLLLRGDALGDLVGVHVLQRHLHAGGDAPAGDVGAHHAGADHVHAQRLERRGPWAPGPSASPSA